MTTIFILLIALVVLLSFWAIIGLNKKPITAEKNSPSQDFHSEFATEIFPDYKPRPWSKELPWDYGDNRITLMPRDPNWLYVYWEINDQKKNELIGRYGDQIFNESHPVLRVYDITDIDFDGYNSHNYFDVYTNDYANSWYIKVDSPDRTFCVDLGRKLSDGTFILMARSNYAATPRSSLSDKTDPEWMMIGELLGEPSGLSFGLSSPELFGITGISSEQLMKKQSELKQ